MLKNPTNSISELEKVSFQLLTDAIEDQKLLVRRLGLRVSELSDMEGQSDLTSYF